MLEDVYVFKRSETIDKLKVLVIGASGGVESLCIKRMKGFDKDVQITGVFSSRNIDFVKNLGVSAVLDYTKGEISKQADKKFDVILDCVGGYSYYEQVFKMSGKRCRLVTATGSVQWLGQKVLSRYEATKFLGYVG
eukprot:snap_masked-scaffold_42-processed-gene-2.41-mRNA-1 protein AED:1.00 eAED:1.00 QI:0/-1/0/0/-1/1/1/0/135